MHVVVIGAGVVGVTTAWYLARDGHQVTVLDAREDVALETSFGNAGGVCPGFAGPWAAPGMPLKALRWMFQPAAPLRIRPRASLAQATWLARFFANCTARRFAANKTRMQKVAHYSMAQLRALRAETGIRYDNAAGGVLQLFQTADEQAAGRRAAAVLAGLGIPHRLLSPDEAIAVEPALARAHAPIAGALHLVDDETGDCHLFCRELAALCRARGVRFVFSARVTGLPLRAGRVIGAQTAQTLIEGDAFVLATGPQTGLLRGLGLRMPVYPVKGYAMTLRITDDAAAPRFSVMDEHSKVMITRLGDRLRAAGVAELAGFDPAMPEAVLKGIRARVATLFPGAGDYGAATWWHGFRPMTPDGPARVTGTRHANLFLNLGHGSNGWTQACGTGRMMADLMAGRPPDPALG